MRVAAMQPFVGGQLTGIKPPLQNAALQRNRARTTPILHRGSSMGEASPCRGRRRVDMMRKPIKKSTVEERVLRRAHVDKE